MSLSIMIIPWNEESVCVHVLLMMSAKEQADLYFLVGAIFSL